MITEKEIEKWYVENNGEQAINFRLLHDTLQSIWNSLHDNIPMPKEWPEQIIKNLDMNIKILYFDLLAIKDRITRFVRAGFRGYFTTLIDLEKTSDPLEGDYAWLAEIISPSTTANVWVFNAEFGVWVDTKTPIPSFNPTIPGTSIPLMDSDIPTTGFSLNYAPIDHQHPTDNKLVKKTSESKKIYGTDAIGEQKLYDYNELNENNNEYLITDYMKILLSQENATEAQNILEINQIIADIHIKNNRYMIGDICFRITATSPAYDFGGTWTRWGQGRMPVGVDELDADFDEAEKTGGEKKHTLIIDEIPAHNHSGGVTLLSQILAGGGVGYWFNSTNTGNRGGGLPHNNLQPYITCYMWVRTA